jgi:1-acyl-sn-glycerol-3-phosphate acyltransferase
MQGEENLPRDAAIFVGNHQSALDIPVMGSLCNGFPHVWLVLAYYVDTPVLGFFIRRMFIPVDRAHAGKAARSLLQVYRFIKDHQRHLIIFPEGARFIDGEIHPFYEGFAVLAKKTGRPVIPVLMPNNRVIYPPASFYIYPGAIKIIIGEPFYYKPDETDEQFTARVRDWFVRTNEKERVS